MRLDELKRERREFASAQRSEADDLKREAVRLRDSNQLKAAVRTLARAKACDARAAVAEQHAETLESYVLRATELAMHKQMIAATGEMHRAMFGKDPKRRVQLLDAQRDAVAEMDDCMQENMEGMTELQSDIARLGASADREQEDDALALELAELMFESPGAATGAASASTVCSAPSAPGAPSALVRPALPMAARQQPRASAPLEAMALEGVAA